MRVQVSGQKDLFRLAHNLHAAGQKNLKRELDKGSRQAGKVVADAVTDNSEDYIPRGFEADFRRSLRTRVEVRLVQSRRISVVVWAEGKVDRRDIVQINKGDLAHPIHGRFRRLRDGTLMRNPWVSRPGQTIRAGIVDVPAKRAMPRAIDKIEDAVERVIAQIERTG